MTDSQAPELLPCPFCGSEARLLGGPDAQETYSIWCKNQRGKRHHLDCGTMDRTRAVNEWNRRAHANALIGAAYEDAADTCADSTWRHEGEDAYSRGLDRGALEQASTCAAEVRSRIPSDAQAALDRIREEGRVAGLREAADIAETWYRNQCKGTPHEEIRAHIALMELQRLGQEWDAENG